MFERLENLEIFVLSEEVADKVWNEIHRRDSFAKNTVGSQLVKSIDSIGANIAESFGRYHY